MKIGIIGVGSVGSACAYTLVMRGIGNHLVLVDQNHELARAQAEDILHATPFTAGATVQAGGYEDLEGCGIVIIAAGAHQKPGQTRLDLLCHNAAVIQKIVPSILQHAPQSILLIASNPVDILTQISAYIAYSFGVPPHRIIGSGTILDTMRYKTLLSQYLGVSPHSIHAHVLGEHGDSEVFHWSGVTIGTMPLLTFTEQQNCLLTPDLKEKIAHGVRNAAASIIKGKGMTCYGIAAGIARLAEAIIHDENTILTCSLFHDDVCGVTNVALSLPAIVNAQGASHVIRPLLDEREEEALHRSASILFETKKDAGFQHYWE